MIKETTLAAIMVFSIPVSLHQVFGAPPQRNEVTPIKVRTFLETSDELRNYERNGFTSSFTGELRPIPENIQFQLKKNLPDYQFHIAKMSVLIDPPQKKYDLILITSANTGEVKSYLWGQYWMIPAATSFDQLLAGRRAKSKEDAINKVTSLAKLIAYAATAEVGEAKVKQGKLNVELLRGKEVFSILELKLDKQFKLGRLSIKGPNGKDLRHFVKRNAAPRPNVAIRR
jgi:hypothetical protein